jgi:hypothetical protein
VPHEFRRRNGDSVAFCALWVATLCLISQPKWGSNGEDLDKGFVCNKGEWGHMGRNRVSPLEMGTRGGGRVLMDPQLHKKLP